MIPLSYSVLISALSGVYQVGDELQIYFQTAEINKKSRMNKKDWRENRMLEGQYKNALTTGRF